MTRVFLAFFFVTTFLSFGLGQQPPASLTLSSTTRMVVLDVVATDKAGKPVTDLKPGELTVLENGVAQRISSFEAPADHFSASPERKEEKKAGPNIATQTDGPITILVLDELNSEFLDNAYARDKVRAFLRNQHPRLAQPTCLLALTSRRLRILQDYTQNAADIENALERHKHSISFLKTLPGVQVAADRLGMTLDAVDFIAAANAGYRGRKNLIWMGEGFPILNSIGLEPSERLRLRGAVQTIADLLMKARITVYTVDVRGLQPYPAGYGTLAGSTFIDVAHVDSTGDMVFESLAPDTGGKIFRNRNDLDIIVSESVSDGSQYYTLSYYPSNRDWNGEFRAIALTSTRKDLVLRSRRGYYGIPEQESDSDIDASLSRAVRSPMTYYGIDVHPAIIGSRRIPTGTSAQMRVRLQIDPKAVSWGMDPDGKHRCEVTVVSASLSADGRTLGYKVRQMDATFTQSRFEKMDKPIVLNLPAEVMPKSAKLRIVVRDAGNGRIGSADLSLLPPASQAGEGF